MKVKRDLTDLAWAKRLGRPVIIRTNSSVQAGIVTAVGINFVTVDVKPVMRDKIKEVADL